MDPPPGPIDLLNQAEEELAAGDYDAATALYSQVTVDFPTSAQAPQALFQLAILHWNPASPTHDPPGAFTALRRISSDYPESAWAPAARVVLALARDKAGLERTLATLQAQLDQLKALDLEPQG